MIEYEIREDGIGEMLIRYRATGGELRSKIDSIMREAAALAASYMHTHVPYHTGQLSRAINVSREGDFGYGYRPGGAGGGGFYEIHVGVNEEMAPHVDWVIGGTGIYGPSGNVITAQGNVMVFPGNDGGKVFTQSVRGQKPQTSWYEVAHEVAETSIRWHLARL